jgi:hypothetical protein
MGVPSAGALSPKTRNSALDIWDWEKMYKYAWINICYCHTHLTKPWTPTLWTARDSWLWFRGLGLVTWNSILCSGYWVPDAWVPNFRVQGLALRTKFRVSGYSEQSIEFQVTSPEPRNQSHESWTPKCGTRVSGTRYSEQSIKFQVTSPEPRTWLQVPSPKHWVSGFGTRDSELNTLFWVLSQTLGFRKIPSPRCPSPEFEERQRSVVPFSLHCIQDVKYYRHSKISHPSPQSPSPESQISGFGDPELSKHVECQGIQNIGDCMCQCFMFHGLYCMIWELGVRDSVFRTVLSSESWVLNPELQAPSSKSRTLGLGVQDWWLGVWGLGLDTILNTESLTPNSQIMQYKPWNMKHWHMQSPMFWIPWHLTCLLSSGSVNPEIWDLGLGLWGLGREIFECL